MGNTYQVRTVTTNGVGLPASGDVIREEHLNDEFTSIIAAFNASTGHVHNGTDSPRVTTIGANNELGTSTNAITPGTATIDVGASGNKFRDGFYSGTVAADTALQAPTIKDTNGRDIVILSPTSTAVNQFTVANAATTGDITLSATGSDTNVSMVLTPKGSGLVKVAKDDLAIDGTAITATAAELNVLDGDVTTQSSILLQGTDGVVISDGDVMTQALVSDFSTYVFDQTSKDQDDMADDSNTHFPTQQSVKAYVDSGVTTMTNKTLTNPTLDGAISGTAFLDDDTFGTATSTTLASSESIKAYVDAQNTAQDLDIQGDSGGALSIDLDAHTLDIAGGTGIDTSGSGQTITVAIDSTVTTNTNASGFNTGTGYVGIKNGGTQSELRLYCESANAHYLALQAPAHSVFTPGNKTLTFPALDDTVVSRTSEDTLTNKTLTSPKINENVALSSTSTELNYLNTTFVGSSKVGKAMVLGSTGNFINNNGWFKAKGFTDEGATHSQGSGTWQPSWHLYSYYAVTLTGSATFDFSYGANQPPLVGSGPSAATYLVLKVIQDGSGNHSITWGSEIKWKDGGTPPTLTGTANSVDIFVFYVDDYTTPVYYGFVAGKNVQ